MDMREITNANDKNNKRKNRLSKALPCKLNNCALFNVIVCILFRVLYSQINLLGDKNVILKYV